MPLGFVGQLSLFPVNDIPHRENPGVVCQLEPWVDFNEARWCKGVGAEGRLYEACDGLWTASVDL